MADNSFISLNTTEESSVIQERMSDVMMHIYSQLTEYEKSKANAQETFDKLYKLTELMVEYFRQTFSARGVSVDEIYCTKNDETCSFMISILWRKISFTMITNDKPQYLYRDGKQPSPYCNCCRILAVYGDCVKIINDNPDNYDLKLVDQEIASLYVFAQRNEPCEMRFKHLPLGRKLSVNYQYSAREFLLKVIESVFGGGIQHTEKA